MTRPVLAKGRYRHYKGAEYEVLGLVCHSETEQWLALYRPLYGEDELWVRPYNMFIESVTLPDGTEVARFERCNTG